MLSPWLIGKAIDAGMLGRDVWATVGWTSLLLVAVILGTAGGILQHTLVVPELADRAVRHRSASA